MSRALLRRGLGAPASEAPLERGWVSCDAGFVGGPFGGDAVVAVFDAGALSGRHRQPSPVTRRGAGFRQNQPPVDSARVRKYAARSGVVVQVCLVGAVKMMVPSGSLSVWSSPRGRSRMFSTGGWPESAAGHCAGDSPGGAKNSNAMPSGSRKLSPDP
jgi:hypothetical protein